MCKVLKVNIPQTATKQLKLQSCATGKKLVVSTNWLPLFGFEKDARVIEEVIAPFCGMRIRLANAQDVKTKKIYTREYKSRRNNPIETMLDIRGQKLLNEAFPEDTKTVHIVFAHGEILITPIADKKAQAIKEFKSTDKPLNTFLAASSGIDGYSLSKQGFSIETLLEFRPNEARDKRDFTETGAMNALCNFPVNNLINEDIMNIDIEKLATLTSSSSHTFFHFSPQCDDFSNVKAKSLKDKSLEDNSSTLDMILDGLNIIQKFNFPVVMLENVAGFRSSDIGKMTISRLKRLGYSIHEEVCDARDFGGLTSRKRYYCVATLLPTPFKMPQKTKRNDTPIWDTHIKPLIDEGSYFRLPASTKSLQDGIACGRARTITPSSLSIPTVLKSQNRMAKDSCFVVDEDGVILFPRVKALQYFMGIDEGINLEGVSDTIASEIIGQSIDVPLHEAWTSAVQEHIESSHSLLNNRLF